MMDALRTALLVVAILAAGCQRGYVIDVPRNRVTFQTWDEGNGTQRFPVIGADAATFEAFEIPGVDADSFAICAADDTFARDATAVYWKGWPVPGCDAMTFQPVRPPSSSRVWQDGGRLWDHGGRTDREEWIFRVVDETSGDDHRGPPRMAFLRRPLPVAGP